MERGTKLKTKSREEKGLPHMGSWEKSWSTGHSAQTVFTLSRRSAEKALLEKEQFWTA